MVCTAVAYALCFRLRERAGATSLLPITFPIPVPAAAPGTRAPGERPETLQVAGMALIAPGSRRSTAGLAARLHPC